MSFAALLKRTITTAALFSLLLTAAGCSWWRPVYQSPDVELLSIELKQARFDRQQFLLRLRVENRSSLYLPVYSLDYQLFVDRIPLGEGSARPDVVLSPHSEREFALQLNTRLLNRLRELSSLLRQREPIPWRIEAEIDTGWFGPTIEVRRNGILDPRRKLEQQLQRPQEQRRHLQDQP